MIPSENPQVPDTINNNESSALGEFATLLIAVALILLLFVGTLTIMINWLAPYIPFEWEPGQTTEIATKKDYQEARNSLQVLADDLSSYMELPDGMKPRVHLVDGPPNAFAMLGGNVFITNGLIDSVESENGLAMVMAHELAHLKHRDPITAMSRGVIVGIVLTAVLGSDSGSASTLVTSSGNLALLSFNRKMETSADAEALKVIVKKYGHSRGAEEFFTKMQSLESEAEWQALFRTHPLSKERVEMFKRYANSRGNEKLTPLAKPLLEMKAE